jgi:hypothetical protein
LFSRSSSQRHCVEIHVSCYLSHSSLACNPPKGPPPRTLSFSSSKSQAQRLYNAQKILKLKKQKNVLLSEDIQPYIYASDGGEYVSSVKQLPWEYNQEIGIGPSTRDNPEPNYYVTDAGLNAMSCQLGRYSFQH